MPDLSAQLRPHDDYTELPVIGYAVWWRDDDGLKWSGRMPRREVGMVVGYLNLTHYPITFWRTPVYHWECLMPAGG